MSAINIRFEDGELLQGRGSMSVESGRLVADGDDAIQECNVLYLELDWGVVEVLAEKVALQEGSYVICKAGLFKRVDLGRMEEP